MIGSIYFDFRCCHKFCPDWNEIYFNEMPLHNTFKDHQQPGIVCRTLQLFFQQQQDLYFHCGGHTKSLKGISTQKDTIK